MKVQLLNIFGDDEMVIKLSEVKEYIMTDLKTEIILCECYDLHHQMVVIHDTDDNLVYLNVKSNVRGFWYRLKYLFGFIKYDFAEFIINEQDIPKFEAIIETLRKQ